MTRKLSVSFAALLALAVSATAQAGIPTIINFDQDPANNDIPAGTLINDVYTSLGVTFSSTEAGACEGGQGVYASTSCLDDLDEPFSEPNIVTLCSEIWCSDISESSQGRIRATFATPAEWVCIDFYGVDPDDYGVLVAYDINNNVLELELNVDYGQLCVAQPGIHHVEFSGYEGSYCWFDAMQFLLSPVAVEPASFSSIKTRFE